MSEKKFTPREEAELIRLLQKVQESGYRWPSEKVMRAAHATVSHWATELVFLRSNKGRTEILLARYDGGAERYKGLWHIPGGYNLWNEDLEETVRRISLRELGAEALPFEILHAHKWSSTDHPFGHPLSLFVRCGFAGKEPPASRNLRWFEWNQIPPKRRMVPVHPAFIRDFVPNADL